MNRFKQAATTLCALITLSLSPGIFAAPVPGELSIDCDKGGDLQRAVDTVANRGGGTVLMSGRCGAVHVDSPFIAIVGSASSEASIEAGAGTAVSTTGVGQLNISNVRLVGGQGLYAVGDQRVVFMSDCEVEAGFIAVRADTGAGVLVSNSDLTGTTFAVRSVGGIVVVERSKLHDSGFGARVFDAELYLIESEVSGSQIIGVQALDRSTVSIQFSQFSENGSSHVSAQSDSRVELFNSEIGSAVDSTQVGLQANHGSKVGLYASDPSYGFWRSASVRNDSFAAIEGVTFHGSVNLRSFSKLVVNGTVTEGSIQCQSASDAICDYAATAATIGCMSAPDACEPLRQFSPEESQYEPREVPFQMLQTQQRRGAQGQAEPPLRLDRKAKNSTP